MEHITFIDDDDADEDDNGQSDAWKVRWRRTIANVFWARIFRMKDAFIPLCDAA